MGWRRRALLGLAAITLSSGGILASGATAVHAVNGTEVIAFFDNLNPTQEFGVYTFCVDGLNQDFVKTLHCFGMDRALSPPAGETWSTDCYCYYWWQGPVNIAGYDTDGNQITWNGGIWVDPVYSGFLYCIYDSGYGQNC